jgi:serine/threonine protein kinase
MDGRIIANRYRLTGKESGAGKILHALDTWLDRNVAIKVRGWGDDDSSASRASLVREAKYLARFQHSNIVTLYDFFQLGNSVGMVMPYFEGSLVTTYRKTVGKNLRSSVRLFESIANAVDYCGSQGIAHRDIKPGNVLIGKNSGAFLCDFGLAAEFESKDHWNRPIGTEPYIPPESFLRDQEDLTRASKARQFYDQFALGVTIYQVLTGYLPFGGNSAADDRKARCTGYQLLKHNRFAPCHYLNEQLPRTVNPVIERMLSVDPRDRFPCNSDAVKALSDAFSGSVAGQRKVFISYAHADTPLVRDLARALTKKKLKVWWDRHLLPGSDWEQQIEEAMFDSDFMLVVLSRDFNLSEEAKMEWRYWLDCLKRPIVSVVIDDCIIPYRLYPQQHVRLEGRSPDDIENIAKELVAKVPKIFAHSNQRADRLALIKQAASVAESADLAPSTRAPKPRPAETIEDAPTLIAEKSAPSLAQILASEEAALEVGHKELANYDTLAAVPRHRELDDLVTKSD